MSLLRQDRSRPHSANYHNSSVSGTPDAMQCSRQIVFSFSQLGTSSLPLLGGFKPHIFVEQALSKTAEDLILECDKLPLLNNDLKRMLQNSRIVASLVLLLSRNLL